MTIDSNVRLNTALQLLGYRDEMPSHQRSNLLHAVALFAMAGGDDGLCHACEARIDLIKAENLSANRGK